MKKIIGIQIVLFVLSAATLGGLFASTTIYDDVQSKIVSVLCLSCIKLDPNTPVEFSFGTATNDPHPKFIIENLTKGPVFLSFRKDVCEYCDVMEPVIKELFNVEFEKEDTFYELLEYEGNNITLMHINIDHASEKLRGAISIYDKSNIGGVPMFTLITLGYDHGFIKPYYATLYGIINRDTKEERIDLLRDVINEGLNLYQQNRPGWNQE